VVGGIGNDWLGSNGDYHNLSGGDGVDWIGATGFACKLEGGSGDDSLLGVGTSHFLFGNDGNDWVGISGDFGTLLGDAGNDYLAATGDENIFNGGTGNDQMVAAAGHSFNRYIFAPGSGQDSIAGFAGINHDLVDLRGFGLASFAALQPFISQAGADTVITLNGADILTLENIVAGTLVADDFQFV
jgi:serralysin